MSSNPWPMIMSLSLTQCSQKIKCFVIFFKTLPYKTAENNSISQKIPRPQLQGLLYVPLPHAKPALIDSRFEINPALHWVVQIIIAIIIPIGKAEGFLRSVMNPFQCFVLSSSIMKSLTHRPTTSIHLGRYQWLSKLGCLLRSNPLSFAIEKGDPTITIWEGIKLYKPLS